MAGLAGESQPELNVLSKHEYSIAFIISQNLTFFSIKFVESAFITRSQSSSILDMYGVENLEKASRLLNHAYAKLRIIRSPEEREKWFKCFLSQFESNVTYQPYRDLAAILRDEYRKDDNSSAGTEDHSSSTGQSSETGEGVTAQYGGGHRASAPSSSPHTTSTADNTSSTHLPPSDKRSGKETPEYKAVINAYGDITRALQMTPSANAELSRRFIQENWIEPGVKCSNDDLLNSALYQIRQKASQFQVFLSMLRDMAGMDLVVKQLQDKLTPPGVQSVTPVAAVGVTHSVSSGGAGDGGRGMAVLSSDPRLAQLRVMRTADGQKIEIIKTVASQWRDIGDLLDFDASGATVQRIQVDEGQRGVESCCRSMFQYWLQGNGVQPASWATLLEILEDSRFLSLVADVRRHLTSQ